MQTGSLRPRRESRGARSFREDPAPLEFCVFAFLLDNNYRVLNDNGYLSLDLLIDDNPGVFTHDFKSAILKSLGLIYYADSSKQISTCKKRLREHLLNAFEGKDKFVMRLASDHLLLIKVLSTLFKNRIKFYTRQGDDIVSQIFGDKQSKCKVKILYDSIMFYILVNDNRMITEALPSVKSDDSLSSVSAKSMADSQSTSLTLRLLREQLSFDDEMEKYSDCDQEVLPRGILDTKRYCRQSIRSVPPSQKFESAWPKQSPDSRKSSSCHSDMVMILPNTSPSLSIASESMDSTWSNFLNHLVPPKERGLRHSRSIHQLIGSGNRQSGVLISYSASRQCGSILTDQGLEVLVDSDELAKAGVPVKLLDISSLQIGTVVLFHLRLLSSEPIPTFEATDLEFTTLHFRQILSSQII